MTGTLLDTVKPVPRDYQIEAAEGFIQGEPSGLIQLPTGCGKTLTCALIFSLMEGRFLFLAHTDELVRQTCRAMLRMGLWPRVEKSDEYHGGPYLPDPRERRKLFPNGFPPNEWFVFDRVWVSSMQSFVRRIGKYADRPFDLLTIDEAHRGRCRTYETIARELKELNPDLRILGLTATPYRADKKNLGKLFPSFAYRMPILDAIDRGWLVDVRGVQVEMKADTSKWAVGMTKHGRDITDGSLRASMKSDECIESIAYPIMEKGENRKGIVFLPGIEAAEAVAAALNELKPGYANYVHGKVPKKERRKRVRQFEDGEYKVLTGCQVFQEGFDVPDVALIVMARPTQSRGLYEQMLGRGLRPDAEAIAGLSEPADRVRAIRESAKADCLVMDFVNNTKFKLVNALDVVLSGADDKRKREFLESHYKDRDANDKRAIREQLDELESLFGLAEALRTAGGPPPRREYTTADVNLYGAGASRMKQSPGDAMMRPPQELIELAYQLLVDRTEAERMSAEELSELANYRATKVVGRKNYGFLMGIGIDPKVHKDLKYDDATYLRKLYFAQAKRLPDNWRELVARDRVKRRSEDGDD